MKTIVLQTPGEFAAIDRPAPAAPDARQALVKVHRIGVCGTDLHAFRGKQPFFQYPRVLGHELGVEVLAVGTGVTHLSPGDRCAVEPYMNCGACIACRRGRTNCCTRMQVLGVHTDGGYTEQLLLPAHKLHRSSKLSYDQLALVETLGIGAHAVQRVALDRGENVLVVGVGPIGLSVIQFALAAGANVIVMDTNPARLEFCRTQVGVKHVVNAADNPLDQIRALTQGDLPTVVFDATGNPQSMHGAFQYVAHGGRLVFVGLFQGNVTFHDPEFHKREMTLLASRNATAADFGRIIDQLERGLIDTRPWITHRAALDDAPAQFPTWLKPESACLKAIIQLTP